ncbi:NYN domain-containing protein [Actinomadura macra]|uniref:NYN domain-containing protein n=1 Tax=Actinomadura macra TaxID=46164 RepID=UPI00082B92F7|nr:NYN domain-containing protein [Actinomadura macra]
MFAYVDNSNVWIEGQRVQAVELGQARTERDAMKRGITAPWQYDFGRLYELACPSGSMVGRSFLVGSRPPPNDSVWDRARNEGFEVEVHDRNAANKEKRVDTSLTTIMLDDSHEHMDPARGDLAVLVAGDGDGDFQPTLRSLHRRGLRVRVLSWDHACSRDLREDADEYLSLNPFFHWLTVSR